MDDIKQKEGDDILPEVLARNPEFWHFMFDAIEDPIFLHDKQYRILLANRAYFREAGMTEAEVLGKPYWEVFPRSAGAMPGCNAKIEKGQLCSQEEVHVGEKIFFSKGYAVRDTKDTLLYSLHILSDITKAEKSLKNTAAKFRAVYDSSPHAIMLLDEKTFFDCNPVTLKMFGCQTRDEFIGKSIDDFSPPSQPGGEGSPGLAAAHIAMALKDNSDLFEWTHRRLDNTEFLSDVVLSAFELDGKQILQARVQDITERKRAEAHLLRLNRMYRMISRGNVTLVHATDEFKLVSDMCKILVEDGGFLAAWVGYADTSDTKHILPVAVAGTDQSEISSMNLTWKDNESEYEPTATTIRTGKIMVAQDILGDPLWAPWRAQAIQRGYVAAASLPLKINDKILGALDIYSAEADMLGPDILNLLAELAGDLAFGIDTIRARTEHLEMMEKLDHSLANAVTAISATVESRDPYTAGHQRRVAKLAAAIATEMGLPKDRIQGLYMACIVHDIGKIHVPAEILSSPGKLSDAEFAIIKTHPEIGWEILKGVDFIWPVAEMVYQHHERLDGSGYPRKLKGDEILLETRILSVADVVEAMSSNRPYRQSLGHSAALLEIMQYKDTLYDPAVVDACIKIFQKDKYEL